MMMMKIIFGVTTPPSQRVDFHWFLVWPLAVGGCVDLAQNFFILSGSLHFFIASSIAA